MASARKPGPPWPVGVALMIIGALLVLPVVIGGARSVASTITARPHAVPGVITGNLGSGAYVVYERTGTRRGSGNFTFGENAPVTLNPGVVAVTGPGEEPVPVRPTSYNETITKGTAVYTGAVRFDVARRGTYTIRIGGERPTEVLVTRSLGDSFRRLGGAFLLALLGGFIGFVGVVLLVVGLVRRMVAPAADAAAVPAAAATVAAPSSPGSPPPGWYPDPGRAGGQRYWDGSRWTDHTA